MQRFQQTTIAFIRVTWNSPSRSSRRSPVRYPLREIKGIWRKHRHGSTSSRWTRQRSFSSQPTPGLRHSSWPRMSRYPSGQPFNDVEVWFQRREVISHNAAHQFFCRCMTTAEGNGRRAREDVVGACHRMRIEFPRCLGHAGSAMWKCPRGEVGIKRLGGRFISRALYQEESLLFGSKAILIPKKSDFFLTLSRPNIGIIRRETSVVGCRRHKFWIAFKCSAQ